MELKALKERFIEIYGGNAEDIRFFESPGRVNIIGEHTDYNGGYVMPAALTLSTVVAARKREDNMIRLAATTIDARVDAYTDKLNDYRDLKWGNYQLGVMYEMQQKGYTIPGCELLYDATLPFGAGLSSSASIEVVTAITVAGLAGEKIDPVESALIGQKAENEYCGCNCGIMDQFASAMGKKDHAIHLDCNTLNYTLVPLELGDNSLVITNTNKPHNLVESKYNERRSECDKALALIKTRLPHIEGLCLMSPEEFEANKDVLTEDNLLRRARHAVYENRRTALAVEALRAGDIATLGELMKQSHISLRDDYEVTGKELDALFDAAKDLEGVAGVRMTGGGFGGCTVAVVRNDCIENYKLKVAEGYTAATGYVPSFYICSAGDGGREITE